MYGAMLRIFRRLQGQQTLVILFGIAIQMLNFFKGKRRKLIQAMGPTWPQVGWVGPLWWVKLGWGVS